MNWVKTVIAFLEHSHTQSVFRGAAIAGLGVALTYLSDHLYDLNLGSNSALVAGLISVLINAVRKALSAPPS